MNEVPKFRSEQAREMLLGSRRGKEIHEEVSETVDMLMLDAIQRKIYQRGLVETGYLRSKLIIITLYSFTDRFDFISRRRRPGTMG